MKITFQNSLTLLLVGCLLWLGAVGSGPQNESSSRVGDIKYSIFPPDVFMKMHQSENWQLMDGTPIDESWEISKVAKQYQKDIVVFRKKNGKNVLPNALGQFIRSMNYRNKGADPEKRTVGGPQAYSTALPKTGENRFHVETGFNKFYVSREPEQQRENSWHKWPDHHLRAVVAKNWYFKYGAHKSNWIKANNAQKADSWLGVENNPTIKGGDKETRPTNVAFYCYIRVD